MVQNGRISDFHGLLTLTLTLDPGMVIVLSLTEYYLCTKFHQNRRNFLWTDGRTYVRTHGRKVATQYYYVDFQSLEVDLKRQKRRLHGIKIKLNNTQLELRFIKQH